MVKPGEIVWECPCCSETVEGDREEFPNCFMCGARMEVQEGWEDD